MFLFLLNLRKCYKYISLREITTNFRKNHYICTKLINNLHNETS